ERFSKIYSLMKLAYFHRKYDVNELIYSLIEFSIISRKEGLLTLEKHLDRLSYHYPRKLVRLVVDGTDAESLQNIAYAEMKAMQERHFSNIVIFSKMGGYAPTMGILGTVMGLVMTLANAGGDPNNLIHNIATAFIATLWGVFSANLIWLPIGDKLKQCHLEERHMMEISLEGVLALQSGEIPSVVKARLISMLPQSEQEKIMAS
ncbi:MAG: motility protein A, partial [Bacillota bacterium]